MDAIEATYAQMRSHILARHFAVGRYFPAYHFGNGHVLGEFPECALPAKGKLRIACSRDGCVPRTRARRAGAVLEPHYADAASLLALSEPQRTLERWRVWRRDRTNPLLMAGLRIAGLAIEHRLGSGDAIEAMERWLDTTETLFKFRHLTTPMAGYVVRWDAATSDHWAADVDRLGNETPVHPCEFLLDPDPRRDKDRPYLYCTPSQDSRYADALLVHKGQDRFRRWEPSIDEYTGLVVAYLSIVDALSEDLRVPGPRATRAERVIAKVKIQTGRVARYLQAHAYVMVRPCGGVTIRGAGETNPCMAYGFSKAFERILGQAFPVTASFDDAMQAAGLADCIARASAPPLMSQAIDVLRDADGVWAALLAMFGDDPLAVLRAQLPDFPFSIQRAVRVLRSGACFDILEDHRDDAGAQFALCSLLSDLSRANPVLAWRSWMAMPAMPAHDYKTVAGLLAIGTGDAALRSSYLAYYAIARLPAPGPGVPDPIALTHDARSLAGGSGREWALPTAIALHLRLAAGRPSLAAMRQELLTDLTAMATLLTDEFERQPVVSVDSDGVNYAAKEPAGACCDSSASRQLPIVFEYADKVGSWHGFMTATALAWWHARRTRATRPWRELIEPTSDSVAKWPVPVVPAVVAARARAERIILPRAVTVQTGSPARDIPVLAHVMPGKPDDGALPRAEPAASRIVPFRVGPNLLPTATVTAITADVPPPRPDPAYLETHELVATVAGLASVKAEVPAPVVSGTRVTLAITLRGVADQPLLRVAEASGDLVCSWLPRQSLR
ncbi:MAG: hypothetical protein FJX57_01635 [Alphaproteobacteria bacterium]|nr:hypothetical protein [Alphaproteobacteria bacterium]